MISIKTPNCNSPLPPISNESLFSFSENVIATFVSASAIKRFLIKVEVTFFPSVPAKGESLTIILIDIVGGSIGVDLIGVFTSGEQIVSATDETERPAIQTISPVLTSSTGIFFIPSNLSNFVSLPVSTI